MARPVRKVSEFLDKDRFSSSTIRSYGVALRQFFATIKDDDLQQKDIDEKSIALIIKLRAAEYPDIEAAKYLKAYSRTLAKVAPNTKSQKIQAIRTFLKSSYIEINSIDMEGIKQKGNPQAITRDFVPDANDVMRMCEAMGSHARVMTMVLATSGLRLNEVLKLTIDDIDLDYERVKLFVRHYNAKNGKARESFISNETKKRFIEWLDRRDGFIEKNLKFVPNSTKAAYLEANKNRVFPWTVKNWFKMWNKALEVIGQDQKDPVTGRRLFTTHKLRKFFKAAFPNPEVAEYLSGRDLGQAGAYSSFKENPKKVIEEYLLAEPKLAIYEYIDTQRVQILQEKIETIEEDKVAVNDNLNHFLKVNRLLSGEIDELKVQVNNLHAEMSHVLKWMETEINSRAVLLSGGTDETILASEEELADLRKKRSGR